MQKKYYLMHKDERCGMITFDEETGRLISFSKTRTNAGPYLGNADLSKMKKWWEMRAVPSSRKDIQTVIRESGCLNTEMYLAKNLALSMTDTYWLCPEDINLTYDQVKLTNLSIFNDGKMPYHNTTSYDPNASLGGQMEKYWDLSLDIPILVKESSKYFGQQSVNEVLATILHYQQDIDIPYVRYSAELTDVNSIICKCAAFTSEDVELISAYEIVESAKPINSDSLYDHYIRTCVKNGIDQEQLQNFMDYQIITDFILSNADRHLMNFGVLRDADSLKLTGPAPIYDTGNSMFFSDEKIRRYSRREILERKITSFYKNEEKMLAKVKKRNIVDLDCLPEKDVIKNLFESAKIPEERVNAIINNYETKCILTNEFQHGKTISLYHENEREKQLRLKNEKPHNKLIVMCGVPGSGKTKKANSIIQEIKDTGIQQKKAKHLYSVEQAIKDTMYVTDPIKIRKNITIDKDLKDSVVFVSANEIREEMMINGERLNNDIIFLIANTRTEAALRSGATVVYDASNLNKNDRNVLINIADTAEVKEKELYIQNSHVNIQRNDIPTEKMKFLEQKVPGFEVIEEGWSKVELENPEKVKEHIKSIDFEPDIIFKQQQE